MRVGVTGGAGRLGNVLVRNLLQDGQQVTVLEARVPPLESLADLNLETVRGTVLDSDAVNRLVDGADLVYHLAARIDLRPNKDPLMWPINLEGTRLVAQACRKRGIRMVHCSSHHALELEPLSQPLTEEKPLALKHKCLYHRSKAIAETIVLEECEQGLNAVIVNPGTLIGPYDFEPSMIANAIIDLVRGKMPVLLNVLSDYVDARDVAAGMTAAAARGRRAERYLLTGHVVSLREFARVLENVSGEAMLKLSLPLWVGWAAVPFALAQAKRTGKDPLFTPDVLRASISNRVVSHDKAARELGYALRPLDESLEDCLAWYRQRGWL